MQMTTPFNFDTLESLLEDLPRKQRQLAQALLDKPEIFAFGTLKVLENMLHLSSITVIRFAKRLGYEGYGDMQDAVRRAYFERVGFHIPRDPEASLDSSEDFVTVVSTYFGCNDPSRNNLA